MGQRSSALEGLVTSTANVPFHGLYAGRRVLITGHTGFKGSWLAQWLLELGAEVTGIALLPDTDPSLYRDLSLDTHIDSHIADIRDSATVRRLITAVAPEVIFHLAAQPLVRRSYAEPLYTFETNVMGTLHVLDAAAHSPETRVLVNVTTDKVYENPESGHPFAEDEPLGGHDPYSASKACSEIATASMRRSFPEGLVGVASARAGNVIGGGDWADDRIVPDTVRAFAASRPVAVRNPDSVRPWQHVLDPLSGYLHLGMALWTDGDCFAEAWNFGPNDSSTYAVRDVVDRAISVWGTGSWASTGASDQPHEAGLLRLSTRKAEERLGWSPTWPFADAVDRTMDWYRRYTDNPDSATGTTLADITSYTRTAASAGAVWMHRKDEALLDR